MERWRVWIETRPIDPEGWSERVDELLETLSRAGGVEGPARWGAGSTLGSVFEVEAGTARKAIEIGLGAFERALVAAGRPDAEIRHIEVAPEAYEPARLLGATDVARLLGVSRQRLYQLTDRPGFPPPATQLARGALWRREDIEAFAATRSSSVKGRG